MAEGTRQNEQELVEYCLRVVSFSIMPGLSAQAFRASKPQLPVRMLNCRSDYPLKDREACLKIDLRLFHAGDPVQNGYFMFAFLDIPSLGSKEGKAGVQLTISWPYESGYLDEKEPSDAPT